jgi:hypothetical protein
MKNNLLGILTVGLLVPAGAFADEVPKELARAVKKTAALTAYRLTIQEQPGQGAKATVEGKYQKNQPVFFRAERIEFFKRGKDLVYQDGGQWHKSKTGIQSDPLRILGAGAKVRAARLPHEELTALDGNLEKVKKAGRKDKDHTIYTGDLSAAALQKLTPTEFAGLAQSGTGKLWINARGLVVKYAFTLKVKGRRGNAEIDGSTGKTVALDELGSARVKVPEAARKLLPPR